MFYQKSLKYPNHECVKSSKYIKIFGNDYASV